MSSFDRGIIESRYGEAREYYARAGIDTGKAIRRLSEIPVSIHCWQGDDVRGFMDTGVPLSGGIQVTGRHPGRAKNAPELRADLDTIFSLIPGPKRLNLHAIYAETGGNVSRDALEPAHFANWVQWAKAKNIGLDFNPTLFSHPLADDGFTLSHPDPAIRDFWIRHCVACRDIGEYFGKELGTPCVTNIWIPDGFKDNPADRLSPRIRLRDSLDRIFDRKIDERYNIDSLESKVFGIGSEAYVAGSHEFYMGYALSRGKTLCLDTGHFHPTESVPDKISALLLFTDRLLIHLSRPMRWDSDHVLLLDSVLEDTAREIARYGERSRIHLALDFFDASINRLAAWTIGARNARKALLFALLENEAELKAAELTGDFTRRIMLQEEAKTAPRADVWDYYCLQEGVPAGDLWYATIMDKERKTNERNS